MPTALEYVSDGDWNAIRRNTDTTAAKLSPKVPQARVYNTANISVANNTNVALTFDSERYDEGDLHSTSANTGRLTAPVTGLYDVGCCVRFASNATGYRSVFLQLNGATVIAWDVRAAVSGVLTATTFSTQYRLVATDYVEVVVGQTSGGALNVEAGGNHSPEFWMHRISGYVEGGL